MTTNRECQWAAATSGNWIQLDGNKAGQGDGRVSFSVVANSDPVTRRGAITVGDTQLAITQEGAPCTFSVSPINDSVPSTGQRRTITVTASSAQCTWEARSQAGWLTIVEGAQGIGSGNVVYDAQATTGPARTASLIVAGQTVTVTQGVGCSTAISPVAQTVGGSGGSGTITVSTGPGCPWAAQSDVGWIAITSGQTGAGSGTVGFSVAGWDGPTRTGTLRVDTHVFTVTQTAGCSFTIEPESQSVPSSGGSGSVNVRSAAGCGWPATSNAPWLRIRSGASGNGNGTVEFTWDANSGPPRNGTLTVAGRTFTVNQASGCTFNLSSATASFGADGGDGSVQVIAASGCRWIATSAAPWIRITSPTTGSGGADVRFQVERNDGAQRSGTLTIEGRTFTVTQAGSCALTIAPTSQPIPAAGGGGTITVTTAPGCQWTAAATPTQTWVRITSATTGSGNGSIAFQVDANPGAAREATISVNGRNFIISQAAVACSYSIAPTSQAFDAAAATGTVTVSTGVGCPWTASAPASDSWVQITSGASGNGGGPVQFAVAQNLGGARNTTLTIAGHPFAISQAAAAPCSFSINPTSQAFEAAGGTGSISVSASGGSCSWTASEAESWVQITSGPGGNGGGTVEFSVERNAGAARTGTLTIAGHAFVVSQAGACSYVIAPASQLFDAAGGTGSFSMTAPDGCAWTAVSNDTTWLQITSPASGSGAGTVTFNAVPNNGPARTTTIVAAGQTFTATQNNGCTVTISPAGQAFEPAGGNGAITVTTGDGCQWSAGVTSGAEWITISAGNSGGASGSVQFTIAQNTGAPRSGTITVNGQNFTVTQGGM